MIVRFEWRDPDEITSCIKCDCGALTVTVNGNDYCMRPVTFKKIYNKTPPRKVEYWGCNHCVNHWGVDLCACGSGNPYDKCNEGYAKCGKPMQILGKYTMLLNRGGWLDQHKERPGDN